MPSAPLPVEVRVRLPSRTFGLPAMTLDRNELNVVVKSLVVGAMRVEVDPDAPDGLLLCLEGIATELVIGGETYAPVPHDQLAARRRRILAAPAAAPAP